MWLRIRFRAFVHLLLPVWLGAGGVCCAQSLLRTNAPTITLRVLMAGSVTYRNVAVYSVNSQDVFFEHDGGLGSAKTRNLDAESLRKLGFAASTPAARTQSFNVRDIFAWISEWFPTIRVGRIGIGAVVLTAVAALGIYLSTCFLFRLIWNKAEVPPGVLGRHSEGACLKTA